MTRRPLNCDRQLFIDLVPILVLEALNAWLLRRLHKRFRAAG